MNKLMLALAVAVVIGAGCPAWASLTFKFASGTTEGYIDDPARWTGTGPDCKCASSGTILVTNEWSVKSHFSFGVKNGLFVHDCGCSFAA